MNGSCLIFGVLFTAAGVLFGAGKLHSRLAAWQAMPPEEKEKIRIEALCRNIGGMIALCGLLFLLAGVSAAFQQSGFVWSMVLWLILAGADLWWIEQKGRYYRA